MRIVASQLEGKVEKVVLKQYLFDKRSDAPFDDYETPTPNEEQLVIMGRELLRTVPQVSIIGDGFSNDFRSDR